MSLVLTPSSVSALYYVDYAYSFTLTVSGGIGGALTWTTPGMPSWLTATVSTTTLPGDTITVEGTPSSPGSVSFSAQCLGQVADPNLRWMSIAAPVTLSLDYLPLEIVTLIPPTGRVGTSYAQQFTAAGGLAPYSWTASGLPPGLVIAATTGDVTGTPAQAGTYPATIRVTDARGGTDTLGVSFSVLPRALRINPQTPSPGTVGTAFSETFTASYGTAPYAWTATGLPPGLLMGLATGIVAGTPTTAGSHNATLTVTDSASPTPATATYKSVFVIGAAAILTVNPKVIPDGMVGTAFSETFTAIHGTLPYVWTATGLPDGLGIGSSTGIVSGTPTTAQTKTATITVTDAVAAHDDLVVVFIIAARSLAISTLGPFSGVVGTAYSQTIAYTGGRAPVLWAVDDLNDDLPPGLSLTAVTGNIAGTPTTTGIYYVTLVVTDANGETASEILTFRIRSATGLSIDAPAPELLYARINHAYTLNFTVTNAVGTVTWGMTGILPPVLYYYGRQIAGTAIDGPVPAQFPIRITATDEDLSTDSLDLVLIRVSGAPFDFDLTTPLPDGYVGVPYTYTIRTQNGIGAITFTQTGSPPAGLTIDTAGTDVAPVTGTPTTVGSYAVALQAVDALGNKANHLYSFSITHLVLRVVPQTPPEAQVGAGYTCTFTAQGGTTPYQWTATGLPAGLSMALGTGIVSGNPSTVGTFVATITVTDHVAGTANLAVSFVVKSGGNPPPPSGDGTICGTVDPAGAVTVLLGDHNLKTILAFTTSDGSGHYVFEDLDTARSYFVLPLAGGSTVQQIVGLDHVVALT